MKHLKKFNESQNDIFNIVKNHVSSNNEDLIEEAIEEAGDVYSNSTSELISFVEGYISAFSKYSEL